MKTIFKVIILLISISANAQNVAQFSQSSFNHKIEYDIEHLKYKETTYVNGDVKNVNYFTRSGDTISSYDFRLDISVINSIRERILKNFVIDAITEVSGKIFLLLILNNNVHEIRVIHGITRGFNEEILRVINKIEKNLIFICPADYKKAIVTPFAIRLY